MSMVIHLRQEAVYRLYQENNPTKSKGFYLSDYFFKEPIPLNNQR